MFVAFRSKRVDSEKHLINSLLIGYTKHTYDEEIAAQVVMTIRNAYYAEFDRLINRLQRLKTEGNV